MTTEDLGASPSPVGRREKWIGVYIGLPAVTLAICSLGGGNAAKDATIKNIAAANNWAFFQAKNARRQALRLQIDHFETVLATTAELSAEARSQIDERINAYRAKAKELTSEPATGEGLDELFTRGKALEAERDVALMKDPYFDYGEALLQIAIVMASVAIISGGNVILALSAALGLAGSILTLGGFTLFFPLPFS